MSSEIEVRREVTRAMRILHETWPKVPRHAETFVRQVLGIDPAVIVPAVEEWVDRNRFSPTPSEFREYAWRRHYAVHPSTPVAPPRDEDMEAERERVRERHRRLNVRAKYILKFCETGSFLEMCAIWSLVYESCTTPEERIAYRDGTIGRRKIKEAIRAHRAGKVAFRSGPIAGVVQERLEAIHQRAR